jgi:heat shock protein HslJ
MLGVVMAVAAMGACKGRDKLDTAEVKAVTAKDQYAIDSARMDMDRATAGLSSDLKGTRWELVQLRGLHDSIITPERFGTYSLEFGNDGQALVVGGCNRGGGTYSVAPPKGLTFGQLATTRAMCPQGSLSQRYLGDFARMRSYQLVAGRLYISLVDDGGIYEFVPEAEVVAATPEPGVPVPLVCTDSTGARSRFTAIFSDGKPGSVKLSQKSKHVVLPQVRSADGAKFEKAGTLLWNKGRDAVVIWEGVNFNCMVIEE